MTECPLGLRLPGDTIAVCKHCFWFDEEQEECGYVVVSSEEESSG